MIVPHGIRSLPKARTTRTCRPTTSSTSPASLQEWGRAPYEVPALILFCAGSTTVTVRLHRVLWYNPGMPGIQRTLSKPQPRRWYRGADVPMHVIRRFARRLGERFKPDKIILFGSHAYGTPHADSDVDILVIMPARNQIDQAFRIRWEVPARFPMDLIVRTPATMKWRLAEGDLFHTEIVTRGKVLYEKDDKGMGQKGGRRLSNRATSRAF